MEAGGGRFGGKGIWPHLWALNFQGGIFQAKRSLRLQLTLGLNTVLPAMTVLYYIYSNIYIYL